MIQGYTLTTFPKVVQYILYTTREETGKRTLQTVSQPPKPTEDRTSDSETPVQQVTPLLGTTHRENLQL